MNGNLSMQNVRKQGILQNICSNHVPVIENDRLCSQLELGAECQKIRHTGSRVSFVGQQSKSAVQNPCEGLNKFLNRMPADIAFWSVAQKG